MSLPSWKLVAVLAAIACWCFPRASLAGTSTVYQASISLSAVAQDNNGVDPVIAKVKATSAGIANIARGRNADDTSVPQEVLALAMDCSDGDTRLIVWNLVLSSKVATVATLDGVESVEDLKKGQFIMLLDVESVGDADNSLNGGFLLLAGKYKLGTNGCPEGISATLMGVIDVTVTDDVGTESGDVLVPKGKLKLGKTPLGTLIE